MIIQSQVIFSKRKWALNSIQSEFKRKGSFIFIDAFKARNILLLKLHLLSQSLFCCVLYCYFNQTSQMFIIIVYFRCFTFWIKKVRPESSLSLLHCLCLELVNFHLKFRRFLFWVVFRLYITFSCIFSKLFCIKSNLITFLFYVCFLHIVVDSFNL